MTATSVQFFVRRLIREALKVEIISNTVPQGTIREFADRYDLKMQVNERKLPVGDPARFYASFAEADTKGDGVLIGEYGNGATQEEAIDAYAEKISMKTLVIRGNTNSEREIPVWRLV